MILIRHQSDKIVHIHFHQRLNQIAVNKTSAGISSPFGLSSNINTLSNITVIFVSLSAQNLLLRAQWLWGTKGEKWRKKFPKIKNKLQLTTIIIMMKLARSRYAPLWRALIFGKKEHHQIQKLQSTYWKSSERRYARCEDNCASLLLSFFVVHIKSLNFSKFHQE